MSNNQSDPVEQLRQIIELCRRNKMLTFKGLGFELTFHEDFLRSGKKQEMPAPPMKDEPPQYNELEIALWSSAALNQIMDGNI